MRKESTHYVKCGVCGEYLGDYRPYYAQEHLKQFPDHKKYEVLSKRNLSYPVAI